jgi:hypothetical protein
LEVLLIVHLRSLRLFVHSSKVLQCYGIAIKPELVSVKQAAIELDIPHIMMHGTRDQNLAADKDRFSGESCGFSQNGWGRATTRMNFRDTQAKVREVVAVVTFTREGRRTAEDWIRQIDSQLKRAYAPIQFKDIKFSETRTDDHDRTIKSFVDDPRNSRLSSSEIVAICFIDDGSAKTYARVKSYCLRKGIQSQVRTEAHPAVSAVGLAFATM